MEAALFLGSMSSNSIKKKLKSPRTTPKKGSSVDEKCKASAPTKVLCRFRPQSEQEISTGGELWCKLAQDSVHPIGEEEPASFTFDKVFDCNASQEAVYEEVSPVVTQAFDGCNSTVLLYGQSGSGKSYTMDGPDRRDPLLRGIMPRVVSSIQQLWNQVAGIDGLDYTVKLSMIDIYNERIRDLLNLKKRNLQVRNRCKQQLREHQRVRQNAHNATQKFGERERVQVNAAAAL